MCFDSSAVFTWTNLLVVVVELDGNESEALDLVPLVTNTVRREGEAFELKVCNRCIFLLIRRSSSATS